MKALVALVGGSLLLASCGGQSSGVQEGPEDFVQVRTRSDLDTFAGRDVAVEGTFGHISATHATVTLSSGLVIYVPHFDRFKRGDDWLKYTGQQVRVEGLLHTETSAIPGLDGPMINIRRFETLTFTE